MNMSTSIYPLPYGNRMRQKFDARWVGLDMGMRMSFFDRMGMR